MDASITIITSKTGPGLYRAVCDAAGTPIIPMQSPGPGELVVRAGYESPYAFGRRLRRELDNDNAEITRHQQMRGHRVERATYVAYDTDVGGCLIEGVYGYRAALWTREYTDHG